MTEDLAAIRDAILGQALPQVAFDGWSVATLAAASAAAGYPPPMAEAAFPESVAGLLAHFSDANDRAMLDRVAPELLAGLRTRDKIAALVNARFAILDENAEAERLALRYWSVPGRAGRGARLVWRTADRIWAVAGDTATDYNRYTKRGLLAGVLASTSLVWLREPDSVPAFVGRRIENVMQAGRLLGKIGLGSQAARRKP